MPRTDYWRVSDTVIDGHTGPEPTHTPGASYGLEIYLTTASDSPSGTWPGYVERYQSLLDYGPRAGEYTIHEIEDGSVAYSETHSGGGTPSGTLVVGVRPPDGTQVGRGGWYLVESVEDATSLPSALCQLTLTLTYLAPLAQSDSDPGYQTRAALEDALRADSL